MLTVAPRITHGVSDTRLQPLLPVEYLERNALARQFSAPERERPPRERSHPATRLAERALGEVAPPDARDAAVADIGRAEPARELVDRLRDSRARILHCSLFRVRLPHTEDACLAVE